MTGVLQEGSEISVLYDYFGGREEDSLFEWYRQRVPDHYFHVDNDSDIGQFELVASGRGRNSYPMTLDDVGCRLLCKVTPRNTEGMSLLSTSLLCLMLSFLRLRGPCGTCD